VDAYCVRLVQVDRGVSRRDLTGINLIQITQNDQCCQGKEAGFRRGRGKLRE
jgi:hypothetical protein